MAFGTILARVSGLSYRYGPHEPDVLRDISLTIREDEIVVLIGPSGSGKTTLLSLLGMMRRVEPGHIRLFDTTWEAPAPSKLQRCAGVFDLSFKSTICFAR